jgi:hypothetical protein
MGRLIVRGAGQQNLCVERCYEGFDRVSQRYQADCAKVVGSMAEVAGGAEQIMFAHDAHRVE